MDWTSCQKFFELLIRCLHPVLETGLIAFLIYKVLYFLRGTRGAYVLTGLVTVLMGLSVASDALKFEVINWLVEGFWSILATAVIVIFQPELRRAFAQLGAFTFMRGKRKREVIGEVVAAAVNMSRRRCGALIVFERRIGLRTFEEDAMKLDCRVNSMLLESIFSTKSPLHDGAVIIRDNRIVAARVILPLTRSTAGYLQRLGTRHRAAMGIAEDTDAVVVVVSEETGFISICYRGSLLRRLTPQKLEECLGSLIINKQEDDSLAIGDILNDGSADAADAPAPAAAGEGSVKNSMKK